MADQEIFANPSAADAKGRRAVEAAELYDYLLTWVEDAVRRAHGAAGNWLVEGGYNHVLAAARAQVERLRLHGIESGLKVQASAAVVGSTNADNAGIFGAAATELAGVAVVAERGE